MPWHSTSRRRFVSAVGLGGLTLSGTGVVTARGHNRNFRAHLSGDEEVPAVDTDAQGQVTFRLHNSGDELDFRLVVANLENITAAHIHCASKGVNGPVGVTLFTGGPVSINGVLAENEITEPDSDNDCGWETIDDIVAAIEGENAYVNVHTSEHPGGEIRGQIF